jgi:hypothetical protein
MGCRESAAQTEAAARQAAAHEEHKLAVLFLLAVSSFLCAPLSQAKYAVDEVHYVDEMAAVLASLAPPCLHVLSGAVNTDRRAGLAPRVSALGGCTGLFALVSLVGLERRCRPSLGKLLACAP